ncbi:hypothetical protein GE061_009720 [Apolygus lucorum]|uniref:C2H2-type domain-containing protein n=1 Tax=Apolygus lucorum TaxID=248454 RepID=A0A8S9Y1C7_APOLU|nr:hypothetical protein GE061_009720 [Apolygus lucorum]
MYDIVVHSKYLRTSTMAQYPCFICNKKFNSEKACHQHLCDAHEWPFNDNLNDNLDTPKPWVCSYCSQKTFPSKELYLLHVLNNCPRIGDQLQTRHDEVLEIILDAAYDAYGEDENWQVNSVVKDYPHYQLPCGIQSKPGSQSPDIAMYNRTIKEAVIIQLSVPWESNISEAGQQALTKMEFWSSQFQERGYHCFCYNVEIGSRGFIPSSFYKCLKNMYLHDEDISHYAQECQDVVIKYSQYLIEGRPEGSDEEDDSYDDSSDDYDYYSDDYYTDDYYTYDY